MIPLPNYKEIFDAWLISLNPTKEQSDMAKDRLNVCLGCEFRNEVIKKNKWSAYCKKCGCPLNKKVFSNSFNPCPANKWNEVDSKYIDVLDTKIDKTVI